MPEGIDYIVDDWSRHDFDTRRSEEAIGHHQNLFETATEPGTETTTVVEKRMGIDVD